MGPDVLAEISCVNDHAHIGYLIQDSKMIKTGLGRRHYQGPHKLPIEPEAKEFYIVNSASLFFIPVSKLSEGQLKTYFPEKSKNILYY